MSAETVGELVERLGEHDAYGLIVANSIGIRQSAYNLIHAYDRGTLGDLLNAIGALRAELERQEQGR